ncbi:MAG: multidrug efflux system outer membrane protein [Parvicella sp.]|jgi:multidrug efflux system outer membrane protein
MTKTTPLNIISETLVTTPVATPNIATHVAKPTSMPVRSANAQVNISKPSNRPGRWAIPALILLASGCATQIKELPNKVEVALPETWQVQIEHLDDKTPAATTEPEIVAVQGGWLNTFNDQYLNKYVQEAINNNPDLLSSAAQLKSAIEQVRISGASLWPSIRTGLSGNRTEVTGAAGGVSVINGVGVGGDPNATGSVTTEVRTVSASLDISWEADIWGKLTQRKKSAAYDALAQGELFKAAELSLVANVSRAWYNLVTNKLQVNLANQRLESFERTANLIDENYKRGLRSALDVYLSRTDVQLQISALAAAQFDYQQSLRTFKNLLGQYPNTDLEIEAKLPELAESVPFGLPAQLLTRRPDIKARQLQYKSSIANAKAANRDRYPTISFSGSIGDSRDKFDSLFENDNMVMTLIAGIAQPVFQAGALKSREQQAVYQAESSYAALVKTTLDAFQDVEDSLSRENTLQNQHHAIKEAVKFAQGGLDLALDRYQSGIENYTTVLESQRRLFGSMRDEINLRNALVQNRVGIHLALGGDFSSIEARDPTNNLPSIRKSSAQP